VSCDVEVFALMVVFGLIALAGVAYLLICRREG
jgi:hypothetical protein